MRQVTGDEAGKKTSLNEKLQAQLKDGKVNVSSGDVASFDDKQKADAEPKGGPTMVPKPDLSQKDPTLETAALADEQRRNLADDANAAEESRTALNDMIAESGAEIELTEADKEAFIESLISGERHTQDFALYGGKIRGTFRARSQQETVGIIRHLNRLRRDGEIDDMLEYATILRNILLAAQVKSLNGDEYAELQEPLMRTIKGKDVEEPGWLEQAKHWAAKQEGLNAALYSELRKFEQKYWAMVDGADDQNFLNPEESTSE